MLPVDPNEKTRRGLLAISLSALVATLFRLGGKDEKPSYRRGEMAVGSE
jgi:hypothetical protein